MKYLYIILFTLLSLTAYSQQDFDPVLTGKATALDFGVGDTIGILTNFSDQTGFGFTLNDLKSNSIIVDQSGTFWKITQVTSQNALQAGVRVVKIKGVGAFLSGEVAVFNTTDTYKLGSPATTNSTGITPKQQAEILNYSFVSIDSILAQINADNILYDSDKAILRTPTVGTNIGGSNFTDWLDWWYFAPPTWSTNSFNNNLIEVGNTQQIIFTGTINNPGSATITNGVYRIYSPVVDTIITGITSGYADTIQFEPQQDSTSLYKRFSYSHRASADWAGSGESGTIQSAIQSINAVYPILYGVDSTDFTVTGNPYTNLTKSVTNEGNKSLTLNGDGFIYFLIPKTWSDWNLSSIIDHNGFNVTASFTATDINISSSGLTNNYTNVAYRMYKLNNLTSTSGFTYQINR